ncbi:aminopeptidase N-like isoform X2 [Asterias amurensis]|uniref:aminopeptidase N-like isoform X2 n=1 Tax=Asterias amurensis TaxID=7602 RepID=UPI003AB76B74
MELTEDKLEAVGARNGRKRVLQCTAMQIFIHVIVFCVFTASLCLLVYYIPDRSSIDGTQSPLLPFTTPQKTHLPTSLPVNTYSQSTAEYITAKPTTDTDQIGRLPRFVQPRRYLLNIRPFLYEDDVMYSLLNRSSTFDGWVRIEIECIESTNEITLHADPTLTLHASPTVIGLDTSNDDDILDSFSLVPQYHFLVLRLVHNLQPRKHYEVYIQYSGLMEGTTGFYVSEYNNKKGEKRLTGTTQMEGTYARRTLPCFDEPDLKASFDVEIEHRSDMIALSNGMELSTVELDDHWSRTVFKRVAAMPTFLLAMVVHDFQNISVVNEDGCLIRVWMQPDFMEDADVALNKSKMIQEYYASLLDMKYSLDKLDHVGVKDMAGAMENWGLIIYNERKLRDADNQFITHELGHQWFGNVVTMEWWDDLWLSEGFTSYMEHIGTDHVQPDLKSYEKFPSSTMSKAMNSDATSPVRRALKSPVSWERDSVESQFVSLSYTKGGSIAFMMKHFLDDGVFEQGVQNYLKERAFKNANVDHLWQELTYADKDNGKHNMKKIMDTWTLQAGVPLVTINRTVSNTLIVTQERAYFGFMQLPQPFRERYYIPLTYVHRSAPSTPAKLFLEPDNNETLINVEGAADEDWYLANYLQTGYYYVNYDSENWQRILDQAKIDPLVFSFQNRRGLISQTWDLSFKDIVPREIYMKLKQYFWNSTKEAVLTFDLYDLNLIADRGRASRPFLQKTILEKVNHVYMETGWSETTLIDPTVTPRSHTVMEELDLTSLACWYDNSDCVSRADGLFQEMITNPITASKWRPALRSLVLCNGVRHGGQVEWDLVWKLMHDATDYMEKTRFGVSLTCSTNITALNDFVASLLDSSNELDVIIIIKSLSANPIGRDLAWRYVQTHWDWLCASAHDPLAMTDLIEAITSFFHTRSKLQELIDFSAARDLGRLRHRYDFGSAEFNIRRNIQWIDHFSYQEERFIKIKDY